MMPSFRLVVLVVVSQGVLTEGTAIGDHNSVSITGSGGFHREGGGGQIKPFDFEGVSGRSLLMRRADAASEEESGHCYNCAAHTSYKTQCEAQAGNGCRWRLHGTNPGCHCSNTDGAKCTKTCHGGGTCSNSGTTGHCPSSLLQSSADTADSRQQGVLASGSCHGFSNKGNCNGAKDQGCEWNVANSQCACTCPAGGCQCLAASALQDDVNSRTATSACSKDACSECTETTCGNYADDCKWAKDKCGAKVPGGLTQHNATKALVGQCSQHAHTGCSGDTNCQWSNQKEHCTGKMSCCVLKCSQFGQSVCESAKGSRCQFKSNDGQGNSCCHDRAAGTTGSCASSSSLLADNHAHCQGDCCHTTKKNCNAQKGTLAGVTGRIQKCQWAANTCHKECPFYGTAENDCKVQNHCKWPSGGTKCACKNPTAGNAHKCVH